MEIKLIDGKSTVLCAGKPVAAVCDCEGATDTFERLSDIAFLWRRTTDTPRTEMKMQLLTAVMPTFTMVPSVNYNGNGWGTTPEYTGDNFEGTPWTYAYHRVTIPSCTYSETDNGSVALMAKEDDDTSCSLYKTEEGELHSVLWPEVEGPKTLQRHFWGDAFRGEMEPRSVFEAIIVAYEKEDKVIRYDRLLDFAWRYYAHPIAVPRQPEELKRLGLAYCRFLYQEEENGFAGFAMGSQWYKGMSTYLKTIHRYEVGWVGQSSGQANVMLRHYLETGDKDSLEMGIKAHDSWLKIAKLPCGLVESRVDFAEWRKMEFPADYKPDPWKLGEAEYESHKSFAGRKFLRDENGVIQLQIDACNTGNAADNYFEGYDLAKQCGIDKPEYLEAALGICDFAISTQAESGRFCKSWYSDGKVRGADGTVGCFLVYPLLTAYSKTGDKKYFDSAVRAFDFYYNALEKDGYTTAGALDTYCIDKESSSPLLRDAIALYEITKDARFLSAAENIAWYLSTWIMHYTVKYPADSIIGKMGYDTFGSTSVSTAHQALDQYALHDVISFAKLADYTGNAQWREKAIAFWCNATQCISDGTQFINGRIRPAGAQDEAIFHTRWGRYGVGPFRPSQWLPAWPTVFRMEALAHEEYWPLFREGLSDIKGKIEH